MTTPVNSDSAGKRKNSALSSKKDEWNEIKKWLKLRKEEGLKIDPDTAETMCAYTYLLDPYGVYSDLSEEEQQIGRSYFARSPGSDIWVEFGDLPKETREKLWEMDREEDDFSLT